MGKPVRMMAVISFLGVVGATAEMRIWTSTRGDTVEAEFINVFANSVVLRRADGKEIKVPQNALCEADIKYLNESIPPEIDIEVDVDNSRNKAGSYSSDYGTYDYENVSQAVKCKATVKKKSKTCSTMPLTLHLLVFGKDLETGNYEVVAKDDQDFSFKDQDSVVLAGKSAIMKASKSSWSGKQGREYEGYLAYVADRSGKVVGVRGSRKTFEDNIAKMQSATMGSKFDKDMVLLNPPPKKAAKRGSK